MQVLGGFKQNMLQANGIAKLREIESCMAQMAAPLRLDKHLTSWELIMEQTKPQSFWGLPTRRPCGRAALQSIAVEKSDSNTLPSRKPHQWPSFATINNTTHLGRWKYFNTSNLPNGKVDSPCDAYNYLIQGVIIYPNFTWIQDSTWLLYNVC